MGCGATKQKVAVESKAVDAARERSASPSKGGLRKSKTTHDDLHLCPGEDLGKVFTIQQAFPAIDYLGNRHSGYTPEEVSCDFCFRHLVNERQELEFYACKRCWSEGRVFAICAACHAAAEMRVASEKLTPLSPDKQRRRSSTMTNLSHSSSPHRRRTSGNSHPAVELQRTNSMRSDTTAVTDEPQDTDKLMPMPLQQNRRRSSGRSSPSRRKRRSSAPETSPKNASAFRRRSDGDMVASAGLLEGESLPERLSGHWMAMIEEGGGGKKNSRNESRHLQFKISGHISGTHMEGQLSGNLDMPNVQWMEEYAWGTMHVTGRLVLKDMKITGSFQASDGGKGKITLEPKQQQELS